MKNILIGILTVIVIIVVAIGIIGLTYIPVGQQAVIIDKLNGETELIETPGLTFVFPVINKVEKVSIAQEIFAYDDTANTNDNIQLTYNSDITYQMNDVSTYYNQRFSVDKDNVKHLIQTEATKSLDRVSNKYTYDHIKANIADIGEEIKNDLNKSLAGYGIEIVSFSIKGITAPESVEKAVNDKIAKQQQAEASEYEVEKAENEAEAQEIKENSVSQEQQQMEMCNEAIEAGSGDSPACYFGDGTYVNGASGIAVE